MRGILRPCKTHLSPALYERWQAHLCGLCLTLRDEAGQPERVLTGYDVLLLSVLVEAQAGRLETAQAGPCPLRAFQPATVVASHTDGARLAAAGALLSGGAGLTDKLDDGDLPRLARGSARRVAGRLADRGTALAAAVGLDPEPTLAAPARAAEVEASPQAGLFALLAPTGEVVAGLFASTAVVAGRPGNAAALARAGAAFGCLVHLLDAVEDRDDDAVAGRFNPLTATGTPARTARLVAEELRAAVVTAVEAVDLVDRELVDLLLGRELQAAVRRVFGDSSHACAVPAPRTGSSTGVLAAALALWALASSAVFVGGGSCGSPRPRGGYYGGRGGYYGGHRPPRYGPPRGYGSHPVGPPPGYGPDYGWDRPGYAYPQRRGYGVVGPSCGQLLACNCLANVCCNACCCGSQCANN